MFALAVPASTAIIAAAALLAGGTVSLAEILYETTAAQHIPPQSLSRVIAYDWFGSLALEPLTLALIGPLAAGIGISTTLWLGALAMTLCQLCVLLVPSIRHLEARPDATGLRAMPPPRPLEAGD